MHVICYSRQLEVRRQSQASVLAFTLLEMGFLTAGCQEGHTRWPRNLGAFSGLHLLSHHRSSEIADELHFAHHYIGNGGSDSGHHVYMASASNH